ncbi:serine protease [Streptomyces atroolivaceus]|uniref:serine protease n=1 Tax=Streptomyces atroolivaceus TaxID=66869 RepID=UPI00365E4D67
MVRAWARRARWAGTAVLAAMSLALSVTPAQAISNGSDVPSTNHKYSYTVAVLAPVIMCAGALIDTRHVVTTATCVRYLEPSDVEVYIGSNKYYADGITKEVTGLDEHPTFDPSTYDNNIAVLTLDSPLTPAEISTYAIKTIPRAAAGSSLPAAGSYSDVTAYGATDPNLTLPDLMQHAQLRHYTPAQCQTYKKNKLTDSMFCAGDPAGNRDLCPGDQGAPLVQAGKLVGISSWGFSCGLAAPNPSSPVFTRISSVNKWINNVVASTS